MATAWSNIEQRRGPHYRRFNRETLKYFKKIGNQISDIEATSALLFRLEANAIVDNAGLYRLMTDNWIIAVNDFGKYTYKEWSTKKAFSLFNFGVLNLIRNQAFNTAVLIESTSKQLLGRIIDTGLEEGLSIPNIAGLVGEFFGTSKKRALRIARTETVSSSNFGSLEGAKQSGADLNKFWIATRDKRTRPTHKKADGQTVGLNEKFIVGGAALDHPGDKRGPAKEVINCRCAVGYKEAK